MRRDGLAKKTQLDISGQHFTLSLLRVYLPIIITVTSSHQTPNKTLSAGAGVGVQDVQDPHGVATTEE